MNQNKEEEYPIIKYAAFTHPLNRFFFVKLIDSYVQFFLI